MLFSVAYNNKPDGKSNYIAQNQDFKNICWFFMWNSRSSLLWVYQAQYHGLASGISNHIYCALVYLRNLKTWILNAFFWIKIRYLLFYNPIFWLAKKKIENRTLKFKTIRFDKKKWKDHLVLHYLISKWIFFLITFRRHQELQILISPKSLFLQTKKFLQNDARIQKRLKRLGFCRKV